jgi:predicted TPR repeat methyltransferase/Flp pilus assembly protein TadD
MRIQLPEVADIHHSLPAWRAEHPQLDALLKCGSELVPALRDTGVEQWNEGQQEIAIRLLLAAAALEPERAAAWADLANIYCSINRLEEALTCAQTFADKDSLQPTAWAMLGSMHSRMQSFSEAETALLRALDLDPQHIEALAALGMLYFKQRRFKEAADRLEAAIELGYRFPRIHTCLGLALHRSGDFSKAAAAFGFEADERPDDPETLKNFALNTFLDALLHEDVQTALAGYNRIAGPYAEDRMAIARRAFHLLSSFGHRDAALKLGRAQLSWAPNDPELIYLIGALAQEPLTRAPQDYIAGYYNLVAERFDKQLVDVLCYRTPEYLADLLAKTQRTFPDVLDLGCGTGLAGPRLRSLAGTLTGVDLSPKMLEKAAERRVYDRLIEGEIENFLAQQAGCFDLVFAADVLVYFGDLAQLMRTTAQALKPGGLFAFSVELARADGYELLPTGRFAHHPSYIEDLANGDFIVLDKESKTIRLEVGRPVDGMLYVLQRR